MFEVWKQIASASNYKSLRCWYHQYWNRAVALGSWLIAIHICSRNWNLEFGIGFIDILYHNVIIPNVYRSKTITWNTCCKKNKIN